MAFFGTWLGGAVIGFVLGTLFGGFVWQLIKHTSVATFQLVKHALEALYQGIKHRLFG